MTVRVVVADDQALVRAGFVALLDAQDGIEVVGEADNGEKAVRLTRELAPDVVLMDIRMPILDGLGATRMIASEPQLAEVKVVVLTTFELDEYVFEAMRSGATGFLVKHTEPADLVRAIRVVAAGDALLSPGATRRLVAEFVAHTKPPPQTTQMSELTDREHEVMELVAEGLTNAEIGERLFMSPATARTHVSRILLKLGARDRTQLVVMAYESGMVRPAGRNSGVRGIANVVHLRARRYLDFGVRLWRCRSRRGCRKTVVSRQQYHCQCGYEQNQCRPCERVRPYPAQEEAPDDTAGRHSNVP